MNRVCSNLPRRGLLPLLGALVMVSAGCSSVNQLMGKEEAIDYKSATTAPTTRLEVPPDLTQLPADNRFQLPAGQAASSTTFSSYSTAKPAATQPAASTVLPARVDMRIERDGNQRWLVVANRPPEQLFPIIRQFWQDQGFLIREDSPQTGVIETDWAENRAKIPQDFLRNTIGRVFDSLWSTGERDMFRTRIERVGEGTEVYITHRGAVEELIGADKTQTTWTSRPNDPGIEAEFLQRLMVRLGSDADRARASVERPTMVSNAAQAPELVTGSGASAVLRVNEGFDRAWRRVGLALDRGGFTVEDRNRAEGIYYVRYVDVDAEVNNSGKPGVFGRLFSRNDKPESKPQYRVKLSADGGEATRVTVLDAQGAPEASQTATRILNVLANQLK